MMTAPRRIKEPNAKYILASGAYIRTFDNTDTAAQWMMDVGAGLSLWYSPEKQQVELFNEGDYTLYWLCSGELTPNTGVPQLFLLPQPGETLGLILPQSYTYFSETGKYDALFSPTVTNTSVTLKDIEIKFYNGESTRLYHFNLNNTCLETVNTVQVSPVNMTVY